MRFTFCGIFHLTSLNDCDYMHKFILVNSFGNTIVWDAIQHIYIWNSWFYYLLDYKILYISGDIKFFYKNMVSKIEHLWNWISFDGFFLLSVSVCFFRWYVRSSIYAVTQEMHNVSSAFVTHTTHKHLLHACNFFFSLHVEYSVKRDNNISLSFSSHFFSFCFQSYANIENGNNNIYLWFTPHITYLDEERNRVEKQKTRSYTQTHKYTSTHKVIRRCDIY